MYKSKVQKEYELHKKAWVLGFLTGLLWLLLDSNMAIAADVDYGSYKVAHSSFETFLREVGSYVEALLAPDSKAAQFINAEFITFATIRLSMILSKWAMDSAELIDIFAVVLLISIVQILIDFYDILTTGLLTWSGDLAGIIQYTIVGNDDVFFITSYLSNVVDKISFTDDSWSLMPDLMNVLMLFICTGLLWLVSIAAFFGMAWSIWGFALAKLIGWFFLPFLLLDKTATLFDGWLRFFLGFLFYAVIIRVNGSLVAVMMKAYFDIPLGVDAEIQNIVITANSFSDVGALMSMCLVSILALFATGKFAVAISGGVGGFGGTLSQVALAGAGGVSRYLK
ncbi:hypothetical protein GCM10007891_19390 [Methylophaga thalassica]|uniref:TrbL/VirB6 plasmid conjugal transfer protein n=1 Tax=Methylophaga thalassica TaxID=40223 RepID=A0ABQ5TZW9_9GAMM|nr:type IV secretion system protein [Methylophaga thalassica]GLQ00086.1 hypothetical protein GCM10007891_19390 [Methylophaga thalassica]